MNKTNILLITFFFLLVACGSSPEEASPSSEVPESSAEDVAGAAADESREESPSLGLCANRYFPVGERISHSYVANGGPSGDFSYTTIITEIDAEGFSTITEIEGITLTHQWACRPEGLVPLTYGRGPAAVLSSGVGEASFTTTNVEGVFLPSDISLGDTWSQTFDIQGEQVIPDLGTVFSSGTASYSYAAIGFEIFDTPAGEFEALEISVQTVIELVVQIGEASTPSGISTQGTSYFVEDIGWIGSLESSDILGILTEHVTLMSSYEIP